MPDNPTTQRVTPVNSLVEVARAFLREFDRSSHLLEFYPDDLGEARNELAGELERWPL